MRVSKCTRSKVSLNSIFLLAAILLSASAASAARDDVVTIKITDDAGQQVSLEQAARRIVSLAPHITEILFAAGSGDRLVGTVNYSDYPAAAKAIPLIGGYNQVNFEKILSLNPDLIIAWRNGNSSETLEMLKTLRIPVYLSEPKDLARIANNIRQMGKLTGTTKIATRAAQKFEKQRDQLIEKNSKKPRIRVFYEAWEDPLYTLGNQHFFSDLLTICGGENIFADLNEPSPTVSIESVVTRDPQVMLSGGHHGGRSLKGWKQKWERWTTIQAIRSGQMYLVDQDIYTRSSPRAVEAAADLCSILNRARAAYGN